MANSRKSAYEKKEEIKDQRIDMSKKTDSILFNNINNLYDSFDSFMKNSNNSLLAMENDLAKPLDDFIENQLNFYNENLKKMRNITDDISSNKINLENSENNYYFSSYLSSQFEDKDTRKAIFRGDKDKNTKVENSIRNKMLARNDEYIFKYEISKYNNIMSGYNEKYNSLLDNILNLEKTKVHFVSSLLTKFKKYLSDYAKMINNFISEIDKFSNNDIDEQDINA
jgi:hypothetical protein